MEKHIWLDRWENKQIGFHENEINPLLIKYFKELELPLSSRIFVPLCGKTLDIGWLLSKGFCVVGVELSEIAVKELFEGLGEEPYISQTDEHIHYSAENIDIYVGDFFALSKEIIGNVDAVYDRAAIVALPEKMRVDYASKMLELTEGIPHLMTTVIYDQSLMDNSPFSVCSEELKKHYGTEYRITLFEEMKVEGGIKQVKDITECVWLLEPRVD